MISGARLKDERLCGNTCPFLLIQAVTGLRCCQAFNVMVEARGMPKYYQAAACLSAELPAPKDSDG